ncbi:DNA repair exonuclease [Halobacillus sp. BBL2006]|uniref:metallophosphoesterase family protein n=1 Tax=Halobacillus sp. BBL2006 TaxID=1543706 RepID=UPI000541960A|nr:DNA repair exonuclease [Halobacillus sp. BBL2006]KHE72791.1 hypothetical protein LD39_02715 [Halobacillus sp. BBL2006]
MHSKIRFIHSADLHLDSLFKSKGHFPERLLEQLRKSTFEAFDRLVDQAINHQVDFVLLVGDLFNESIRSLKAQVYLRSGFQKLDKFGIDVFVSYGNHDYLQGDRYPIAFPANVHVFSSQEVEAIPFYKGEEHIANIYGFSYIEREIRKRKVQEYIKKDSPHFHIAMLHGSLESNTEHDVYAPFLMEELYARRMDYWALGHIHQRQVLSEDPPVVYPGNIQGRSKRETGDKGCYFIQLDGVNHTRTFLPLHSFTYETVTLECENLNSPHDLEAVLEQAKAQVQQKQKSMMLEVTLLSNNGVLTKWQEEGFLDEWIEVVNEAENLEEDWIYIYQVHIEDQPYWEEEELKRGQHFIGELLREIDGLTEEEVMDWLAPLFGHRRALKYIDQLTPEEVRSEMEFAKVSLVEQLLKREDQQL